MNEARLELNDTQILDAMPFAVLAVDADARLLSFNATAGAAWGLRRMDLGRSAGEALGCTHVPRLGKSCGEDSYCSECPVRESVARALATEATVRARGDMDLRANPGGQPMRLNLAAARMPGATGHVVLVLDSPDQEWRSAGPTARDLLRTNIVESGASTADDIGGSSFLYAGLPWQ